MKKRRVIKPGPLPSGPLRDGEVILGPTGPRRFVGKYLTAMWVMFKASAATRESRVEIASRKDLSFGQKLERSKALMVTENTKILYSPEGMHKAGCRRGECVCEPGCDCQHCQRPPARTRSSRRRARRNRPKGKR